MSDATDDERETIYAVYLVARERPEPPEYATLRDLLPGATETTIDMAADAATIGAIHGSLDYPTVSREDLAERLAAKNRDSLNEGEGEP